MSLCYNEISKRYETCSTHLSTYIAVGVIIPLCILFIVSLVYLYLRCRQRQIRRQDQQAYMTTVIPIYHNEDVQVAPYNYSYPPHYTAMPNEAFEKPPSYEQTIQEISETTPASNDHLNPVDNSSAEVPQSNRH